MGKIKGLTREYINRQALLDMMGREARDVVVDCDTDDMTVEYALEMMECAMRDCVANEPTADVAPVKHGEWLNPRHTPYVTCSLCGGTVATLWKGFFCQNCGAKMDGGEGNGA